MPRIKRWFPVSHDINADAELWAMRRQIGEKSLSIWLEILSISDRNESELPGDYQELVRAIAGKCQATVRTVSAVFDFALNHLWVVSEPTLRVRNYAKYHKIRETIKIPKGNRKGAKKDPSLPSEPSEPSLYNKLIPDWLDKSAWEDFRKFRKKIGKPMTERAEELAIRELKKLKDRGDDPKAVIEQSILNGWRGLFQINRRPSKRPGGPAQGADFTQIKPPWEKKS